MKIFYTQLNRKNKNCTEGFFANTIYLEFQKFHQFVSSPEEADCIVFFYCFYFDYEFDQQMYERIKSSGKPIVIFDYLEQGSPSLQKPEYLTTMQILGYQYDESPGNPTTVEYMKLVTGMYELQSQIKLYFKREMPVCLDYSKSPFKILPVEYPITFAPYEPVSEEDYYNRPFDLYFNYGFSNPDRPKLHGRLLLGIDQIGHNFAQTEKTEEEFLKQGRKRIVVVCHREWYERVPFKSRNSMTYTTMDLYGAGMKCFRSTEGTIDTLAFKADPSLLHYSYPWVNGKNCIALPVDERNRLKIDEAYEIIRYNLRNNQGSLYSLYLKSVENNHKYRTENYVKDYLLKNMAMYVV